jgi:hypothetical protein
MIAVGTAESPLDEYARETLQRLPLADATLSLWAYVLQPTFLAQVFAQYRGRSFEDTLTFARFVDLIGDALLEHEGSGRQSFTRAQEHGTLARSSEAVYGKLRRVPLSLSLGFFTEGTARLRALLPPQHLATALPASVADFTVVVGDGKTLKRVAKRLLPARGAAGKVYGGKLLVAFLPSQGVAVAMAADPDGERNECRLVPQVVEQARQVVSGPRLWVLDRQFCDLVQTARCSEGGDHFLIRYHKKVQFCPDSTQPPTMTPDTQGRAIREEWGWLGAETNTRRRFVRRLTLTRPGAEAIILVTDLLAAARYPAADLLTVYLARWGIEISQPHCHHKGQGFASFVALISPFYRSVFQLGMSRTLFSQAILGSPRSTSGGYSSRGGAGAVAGAVPPLPRPPIESSAGAPALVGAL